MPLLWTGIRDQNLGHGAHRKTKIKFPFPTPTLGDTPLPDYLLQLNRVATYFGEKRVHNALPTFMVTLVGK